MHAAFADCWRRLLGGCVLVRCERRQEYQVCRPSAAPLPAVADQIIRAAGMAPIIF
ncbi:MAG: hypothetical protein QCH34_02180 [Methanocalculus sp.]|nr:hypothetical protein [Methanocalculus sp.]